MILSNYFLTMYSSKYLGYLIYNCLEKIPSKNLKKHYFIFNNMKIYKYFIIFVIIIPSSEMNMVLIKNLIKQVIKKIFSVENI